MPDLSFGSYTLPVYLYEDFSYNIFFDISSSVAKPITKTSGLPSGFFTDTSRNFTFAGNGGTFTAGSTESFSFSVTDASGNYSSNSSNIVPVGTGRFTDLSGNGVSGRSYVFYKSEPIPRIQLKGPFNLSTAVSSVPTLPPGLKFYVSGSNLDISGTPLTTLPTSNYLLIGKDAATGSKVITTSNTYTVSNERIIYNQSGTPIFNMDVGTPIASRTLTAAFPPYPSGGTLTYTWNTFPDGIRVFDFNGTDKTISNNFGFPTTDVSHAFTISGTPTLTAAYQFANAGVTSAGVTYSIKGTRTSPLPAIISNADITFAFNETVLFDQSAIPTLYSGVPVNSNANFFRARTYFSSGSGTNISNIFSPDLRADLSLTRIGSYAYLIGTPTLGASSANYTIRATNSNGFTRDYVTPITVANDVIQFVSPTPATDVCYNFILSRSLEVPKTGYYPYPIQFNARAASGLPVTLSAPALAGTGMSLDSNGTLVGFPDTVTPLTTLAVIATATGSPATATRNVKFEVINDIFTFGTVPSSNFNFTQNRAITPFQIPVTTLSERPVVGFSENALPAGLSISAAGVISGTPLSSNVSGTIEIIPTTGYTSGSQLYNYTLVKDIILFTLPQTHYTYTPGNSVSIQVTGTSYSGTTVSNFDLSMVPTYGLNINSTSGLIGGAWVSGIPPDLLPGTCNFTVNATAGNVNGVLPAVFTTIPTIENTMLFGIYGNKTSGFGTTGWLYRTSASNIQNLEPVQDGLNAPPITDIQYKNNDPTNNVVIATYGVGGILRGSRIGNISNITTTTGFMFASSLVSIPQTSNWYIGGTYGFGPSNGYMLKSSDDGIAWDVSGILGIKDSSANFLQTRDANAPSYWPGNSYVRGGLALRYSSTSQVFMAGGSPSTSGDVMLRSTNSTGSNWSNVVGGFSQECAYLSLDVSSTWVATGSDAYRSALFNGTYYTSPTNTIKYSLNQGLTWSNATGGFNMFGYELVYGNNTWIATGVTVTTIFPNTFITPEIRYSSNGINWTKIDLSTSSIFNPSNLGSPIIAPLRLGSMTFDGNYWNVMVNADEKFGTSWTGNQIPVIYRHDISTPLSNGWVAVPAQIAAPSTGIIPKVDTSLRFLALRPPTYLYTGTASSVIDLSFSALLQGGPVVTSPQTLSYLFYQYIPITPIQLAATGTGTLYFFVTTGELPVGLTFDPLTNQISGTPAQIGNTSTVIYVNDDIGTTTLTITFTVIIPRIVRKQDGAGAYTSLLRQYTQVLGAQNARDNRVLPNQNRPLGEFMSPDAPDVVTPYNCKK